MAAVTRGGDAYVASPPDGVRLFLVYGLDAGAITERARTLEQVALKRGRGDQVLRLGSDELSADPGRIADEAYAASLFGGEPVISLRILDGRHNVLGAVQPLLDRPPEAAWLIVEAGDLPRTSALRTAFEASPAAAAILTGEVEAGDLAAMIRSMAEAADVIVQPDAMELLANILGGDRLATRGEIDKLLSYVGAGGTARIEDVEAIVGETAEVRNGQIIDAALLGGAEEVEANLVRLKAESASVSGVASQAVRHLITLQGLRLGIDRGGNPGQVVKTARPPIFFKRQDAVIAALRRWPYPALARARVMLDEAVATSRRQPSLEFAAVSDALQRIASMARRLQGRSR